MDGLFEVLGLLGAILLNNKIKILIGVLIAVSLFWIL